MKKYILGIGLLVLSALVLFQDQLPDFSIPLWRLVLMVGVGVLFLERVSKKAVNGAFVYGTWLFILLNNQFKLFTIGTGTIILGAVLACIGINILFKPKDNFVTGYFIEDGRYQGKGTVFSSSNRYISDTDFVSDSVEVTFGSVNVYFDHAQLLGERGTLEVEGVFSSINLYVPSDWNLVIEAGGPFSGVENHLRPRAGEKTLVVTGELVFSGLKIYPV